MANEAGNQGGCEEAVEKTIVKNKIPAKAEKGKGKQISKGLPDYKSCQDEEKEVPCHNPMKEYLAGMVLSGGRIEFGKAEEVLEDKQNSLHLLSIDHHGIRAMGDETLINNVKGKT